jgi:hypothetical protein
MPNWFIYSHESLPDPDLMGTPGYTPDSEYIKHGGFSVGMLKGGEWMALPARIPTIRHYDWTDKAGHKEFIYMEDIAAPIRTKFDKRGVVLLDHEPSKEEQKEIAARSEKLSLAFRMSQVEWYENQVREKEVTGQGRTKPTPYEDKCYTILGLTKPYSVEAMRAQRHPGEAVGEQIVAALERLDKRREEEKKPKKPVEVGA